MSCCPPTALPYLAAKPANQGSKKAIDGVEFYETGAQSKAAIILFPDVWGWDSGRTRALADAFAEQGYRTYVPKVLQPAHQGGTDGDGLPPDFDLGSRMEEFMGWVKTVKWDGIDSKVNALLAYAKKEGADAIGVVGCCWGGWACFETSAMTGSVSASVSSERRGDGVGMSNAIITPNSPRRRQGRRDLSPVLPHRGRARRRSARLGEKGPGPALHHARQVRRPGPLRPRGLGDQGAAGRLEAEDLPGAGARLDEPGDASDPAVAAAIKDAMTEAFGYLKEHLPL